MKNFQQEKRTETKVTPENYEKRRALNPGCSSKRNVIQLSSGYHPPLLGTQKEFCTEAILKGVPVHHCNLEKPVKPLTESSLYGEKPVKDPPPARSLENWGRWCDEWYKTQLLVRPTDPFPPSIMTAAEGHRRKKEDIEVISRTLPPRSMYGYNPYIPKNTCVERLTQAIYRNTPIQRIRIPRDIRDELSLPYREVDECYTPQVDDAGETNWEWEKNWKKSIPVGVAKLFLRRDLEKEAGSPIDEDSLFLYGIKAAMEGDDSDDEGIPEVRVNAPKDEVRTEKLGTVGDSKTAKEVEMYTELHGPILLVNGPTMTLVMRQRQPSHPPVDEFIFDKMEEFATTTKCKEIRHLRMTNKGTTAIRYQWLRCAPNNYLRHLLANPGKLLQLDQETLPGVPIPVDLLKPSEPGACRQIGDGNKKVAVKMTKSRRVDPFLTRTIKILRNSISANPAYENFLLLLSFRIPRLRRALIQRTGRQLTRSKLPTNIRDLYLKLVDDKKIFRTEAQKSARRRQFKRNLARRRRHIQVSKSKSKSRSRSKSIKRKKLRAKARERCKQIEVAVEEMYRCPCQPETCEYDGEDQEWKVCDCEVPDTENAGEWDGEWDEEEARPEGPPNSVENLGAHEASEKEGSGSSEGFEEIQRFSSLTDQPEPDFADQFDGLNYAEDGGLVRSEYETQVLKAPTDNIEKWREKQRNSLLDPATTLKMSYPDIDGEPFPSNCTTFHELKGYVVRHDFDDGRHLTRIEIEQEDLTMCQDEASMVSLDEDGSREEIPLPPKAHQYPLNTQKAELNLQELSETQDLAANQKRRKSPLHKRISSGAMSLSPSFIHELIEQTSGSVMNFNPCIDEVPGECELDHNDPRAHHHALFRPNEYKHFLSDVSMLGPHHYVDGHPESLGYEELRHAAKLKRQPYLDKMLKKRVKAVLQRVAKPNRVRFIKEPSFDFHFRELPGVLLPGQTEKLEMIFRPRKPGFYNEKVYLMTHPRLGDVNYGIQLGGVCMDPDVRPPNNQEKNACTITDVEKQVTESMLQRQSARAMDSILDAVTNKQNTKTHTLPFGRVSTEDLFYAHNPNLYYHAGVSEKSLEMVQTLAGYFIPTGSIPAHPNLCHLNIQGLYNKILEPVDMTNPNNFFWKNLCNADLDPLLAEFANTAKIQRRPPVVAIPDLEEQKHLFVSRALAGLIDEAVRKMRQVDKALNHPNRALLARRAITFRLNQRRARELESRKSAEKRVSFSSSAIKLGLRTKKIMKDVTTQKPDPLSKTPSKIALLSPVRSPKLSPENEESDAEEEAEAEAEATTPRSKKKKPGKEPKEHKEPKTGKGKKGKKPKSSVVTTLSASDTEANAADKKRLSQEVEGNLISMSMANILPTKKVEPSSSGGVPTDPTLEFHLQSIREKSGNQMKLMVLEQVLNRGIDRLLYIIDSLNTQPVAREARMDFKVRAWYDPVTPKHEDLGDLAETVERKASKRT